MKKIKTKVLLWGLLAATIPSVVLPVVACSTNVSKNNKSYSFDGQTFNSEEELNKYAHNNLSQQTSTTVANNQFWTLNTNGETTKYSDPYLLKNNIEKNIEPIAAQSSLNNKDVVNNSLGVNGEIPDQIVSRVIQSKQDTKLITVYRGRNNSYFTSETEAKKSYLNNHEGYYFNDLYFSNIEGLKQYIDRNYDTIFTNNPNNKQFKVLQSPNGNVSQPIDPSNQEQAKQQVKEFVKNNYKPVYSIQKENTISYVSDTSPTELAKSLTLNDIDPVFLSRNGQGTYIVDTSKDDGANFYGPYFYNGNADVLKITDKSLWKEVGASDRDVLENNRENLLLQTFFALLINENENIDNDNRTLFEIDSLKEDTKIFNQYMEDNVPNLWEKVLAIKSNFAKGKRYNSLIKIPILYTCIFEELVYNGYPNEILTKVKQYFTKICELYDKSIRTIFPKEIITPELSSDLDVIDKNDGLLSFKSLFGFNSQTFDYSVDINYYFDKLKLNFKNIFKATQIATYAFQNGYKYDGVIPYDRDSLSELLGEKLDASYDTSWKYIWEILSCNDENTILNFYNKNKTNINIAYDEFYSTLGHVVAKTKLFKECLKQDFNDAMEEYKSGKPLSSIKLFAGYNSDKLLRKIGNSFTLFCFFRFVPLINDTNQQHMFSGYETNTRFASLMHDSNQQHSNDTNDYPPFSLGRFAQLNNLFNSLETVVDESSEARNIEKIKKYFSDNKDNQIYLVFMKELLGKFDQGFSTTIFKQAIKLTQQIVNLAKGLAEAIKVVKNMASILKAIPALTVACFIVDIVSFLVDALTPNYEQKSYIYRSGNYEFIWDGGYKQTILYGWVTTGERTIDSMKMLNPIKVTNPRTKDFYYLNGKNYETTQTQQLIEEYARLLSIGRIDSDKIKINYTLNNYSNLNVNVKPVDVFDNIDDLANYVYDYVFTQNKQDKFLADYQMYKFTSGNINTTIPATSNKQDAINKVTSLIKPTYIAMLPKVDQYNYPLTNNDSITNDNSITEYMLPGNSYDFKSGTIIPESSKPVDNKYVIVEPNLELSSNSSNSSLENNVNNPRKELETQFFNSFNVDSKIVFETDTIGVNKFTDLDYQPNNYLIYKASSPYGEVKYFLDKEKAFSWLMSKANINYIENKKEVTMYFYKDKQQMFYSIEDFNRWVRENTKVIGE